MSASLDDLHFRMFMSRLHIAKQELESKVLDHERQVASAKHLAACKQLCLAKAYALTQLFARRQMHCTRDLALMI